MDLLENLNGNNSFFNKAAETAQNRAENAAENTGASFFEEHTRGMAEQARREKDFKNRFGFNASFGMVNGLMDAFDSGAIDEDGVYNIITAQTISDNLKKEGVDIPMDAVLANLDEFKSYVAAGKTGKNYTPKTSLKAVLDSFAVSWFNTERMMLGTRRMAAEMSGNKDEAASIEKELRLIDRQIRDHSDPEERNPVIWALKTAAQSSVYTAGLIAANAVPVIGPALAFGAGAASMSGGVYNNLRDSGVEAKKAAGISLGVGAMQAAIENQLGMVGGIVSRAMGKQTLQGSISKIITDKLISRLGAKGVWLNAAAGVGTRYVSNALGEGLEEVLQEITEIGGLELAKIIQKEGITVSDEDSRYLKRIIDSGAAGFASALVMGFGGMGVDAILTAGDMRKVRSLADAVPSQEAFNRESKEFFNKNLSDEEIEAQQKIVFEGRRNIREQEEARMAEELKATAGFGAGYAEQKYSEEGEPIPLGETYRRRNGRLYTQLDAERGLFKVGDGRKDGTQNLYAHIGYKLDENGAVHINEFKVRNDLDKPEFRREIFGEFSESFAGHEIAWDAKTTREAEIYEDLIANNPYGKNAGLNYYSSADAENISGARYRNMVIDNFKRHFPRMGNAEHAVMAAEWEHFANMQGASLEDYVTREFGSLEKAFTTNPNQRIDAAMKEGRQIKGAVTFESLARDAKAVVYLSKNADLTTFIHEMGHIYRRRLDGEMLAEANRLWGVTDGKWTTAQEEQFTEDLERWRREGKAPTPEMQSFFEKFAEFLKNIFNAVSRREEVSPEIKEFFETLYAGEKAAGSAKTAQEGRVTAKTANDTAAGAEGAQMASTAQYEANTSADGYDDIEAWVKTLPEENRRLYRENKALNENRESLGKNDGPDSPKPVIEGVGAEDLEGLKAKAAEGHDFIRELANKWARKWDDRAKGRPGFEAQAVLKDDGRAAEKHEEEDTPYNEMLDMVGFTVVVKDLKTLLEMAREIVNDDAVIRVKDRYKETPENGYQDILLNIKTPNGFIGEIQLNVEQMYDAKGKYGGHALYKVGREQKRALRNKEITEEIRAHDEKIITEMSGKFYGKATGLVYAEAQASAFSLDMGRPSFQAYIDQNRVGDKVLSAFTANKLAPLLAQALLRHSTKTSEGSSKSGTFAAEIGDVSLSTVAAEAGTTELSNISVPSVNSIANKKDSVNNNLKNISEKNSPENERRIEKARAKWEAAERVIGAEDQITLQTGEEIKGHYELGEAGISTPSVDPGADFTQSEGFPVNGNGTSMNVGRDYTEGFSREAAVRMAAEFDQRGMGIIVDGNGVTSSGNNRDISRRIAAKDGTDGKYISYLKSRPERWGFTQADIAKYQHPTVYFAVNAPAAYSPLYFDQFNRSGKKSTSPLETAIKMSYLLNGDSRETVNEFSRAMGNYDSISELYEDTQAATDIFKSLMKKGIVTKNSYPDYVEAVNIKGKQQERVTSGGKEFLESVMLGAVLDEDSIRLLAIVPEIRKRVVKGLAALVDNAALGEYCVVPEINQAVAVAVEVQTNKKKYKSIADYADQAEMELGQRVSTDIEVELAGRLLEKTEYAFADMMGGLNAVLQEEARGQSDMFGGTSKDDILRRYLGVKARYDSVREANNKVIGSGTVAGLERVQAAMDNAGLARSEADGTFFQTAYHGSPYRFNRFDISHMGEGEGAQSYGWGHYFAGKKEVAEWYRRKLKKDAFVYKGEQYVESVEVSDRLYRNSKTGEAVDVRSKIYNVFEWLRFYGDKVYVREQIERRTAAGILKEQEKDECLAILNDVTVDEGQLYEVDIPGDEEMLDWDKKLLESPSYDDSWVSKLEVVREKGRQAGLFLGGINLGLTGEEIYAHIRLNFVEEKGLSYNEAQEQASLLLNDAGFKGIRYLDASSRDIGEGSHNYVIFDDSSINVTQTFFQTAEEKEIIEAAKAVYGTTNDFREAGYLLTDGTVLDFSDKNNGAQAGERVLDHREMNHFDHEGKEYSPGVVGFMTMGNIRLMPEMGGIDLTRMPSAEQFLTLRKYIQFFNGEVTVDFSEGKYLAVENSVTYYSEKATRVINDIINYYEKGIVPEQKPTLFQLDDELIEEAAQYDNWREFRDAYQEKNSAILNGDPIAKVFSNDIPIIDGKPITTALEWIKENPIGTVKTVIGDVEVSRRGIHNSMSHNKYKNKVFVLPAIKPVLEKGAYLGSASDWTGKDINNHYFAAPVYLDGEPKLVFVRVTEEQGTLKKFYVHEVFTEDEIKKSETPDLHSMQTSSARNVSDYYRSIIQSALSVKDNFSADNAWYRSLWNDAKKIYNDALFQEEEKTGRAGELDKRFYKEADKKYLTEALRELFRIHSDQSLKPAKDEDGAAHEDYRRVKRLQQRINTELPNPGSIIGMAAQVRSGRELSSTQYDRLKSWMRKNTRDYRAVLADIMGQEEYLEGLAETKDGEPAGRLANPHPDRMNVKERLKEIAKIIRETDPALAKEIEDGTASYGDPRVAAFEAGVETEYNEGKAALDALEKETAEDYARLANDAQRRIVAAYEKMLAARGQMDSTDEKLRRRMNEEGEIAGPYLKQKRLEQANYDQALKAYNDLVDLYGMDAEVREAAARREARASERVRQTGIRRRQRALRELKEIKQKLVKRVTRKVSFDKVAYEQAEMIKAIQRISEAFIFEGINKWIGPKGREILRGVWSAWSTDEEFRETLTEEVLKRKKDGSGAAERIKSILDKDWKKITIAEKRALHRLLPKTDFINDLKLKELARENRESIQLDIDENYIDGKVRLIIGEDLKRRIRETLGEELFNRILNKPLAEWSIAEAEELARIIDKLTAEGRRGLAAGKEARRVLEQEYRGKVLEALEKTGIVINPDDTPEEKERKEKEKHRILKKFASGRRNNILNNFFDANLRRFTTALDGGRKGIFTSLLYWSENDAYNEEQRQIAARRLVIDKVMKDSHITLEELYREVKIPELEGLDIDLYRVSGGRFTVDDLLYVMRGYKNEETRSALIYGNFSNAGERGRMAGSLDETEAFAAVGHGRMMAVMSYAKEYFAKEENKKFLKLYEAVGADYDANGKRLNKAMIGMFNKPMWRVENYVPMNRREQTGAENESRVIEDLMGTTKAGMKWVNRGFTVKREKISPSAQKPVELGLYRTWVQSVNSTEHLLAYGPKVQTLNAVFKGFHAAEVRQALQDRWGKAADDRIGMTIAEFANPDPHRQRHALDDIVRTFRGKTATAYLAWKMSGVLKQMATSPWPYLQEIPPHEYIAACLEVAAGAGKINEVIREKSIYMKNRDFDPMVKLIREAREKNDNAVLSKIDKFNTIGMKGLEWVDWACVAPGWLAVYKRELANVAEEQDAEYQKLLKKYQGSEYSDVLPTMESKANRALSETMNEEQQDAEAVARADDAVRRMQPSSRSADLAPLFKGQTEVYNLFLQFQTALNVIWQNIRYDLPLAVKEKQTLTVVGMVTGYMMAGICLGMLSEIGNGDDDDEEGKLARRILFYSFTQFTDAVPVIGENVTAGMEALITGKTRYSGQQNLPVIEKGFRGAEKIIAAVREENPEKKRKRYLSAVKDMGEAAGIAFGLPVSGIKELGRAAGIGDGDGELGLYWQALLGQRKK